MTDNAWAYKWSLRTVVAQLGARQIFIRPHCPWQNGNIERLNRTPNQEWAYAEVYASDDATRSDQADWLHYYNHHRPHPASEAKSRPTAFTTSRGTTPR